MIPAEYQRPITQADFGELVGISQPAVSELVTSGALPAGATGHEWTLAYCRRLRERAARWDSGDELVLTRERAALARAQRLQTELKTSIARGEYAPIGLLEDVLATASSAIADRLEGLEGVLRRVAPELPEGARDAVLQAIASARNEWVRSTQALVVERLEALDGDDEEVEPS